MGDFTFFWGHSGTRKHIGGGGGGGFEIKWTKSMMKQDFAGEALSKQNIKASLALLSCNLSRMPTEWSVMFAFSVWFLFLCKHYGSVSLVMGHHLAAFCSAGALLSYSLHSVHALSWKHNLVQYVTKKQTKKNMVCKNWTLSQLFAS